MKKLVLVLLSVVLVLTGCTSDEPRIDGSWGAVEITSQQAAPRVEMVEFNILGKELTGSDGCGPIKARVELRDGKLLVGPIATDGDTCSGDAAQTAQVVQELLKAQPEASVVEGVMRLKADGTELVLEKR